MKTFINTPKSSSIALYTLSCTDTLFTLLPSLYRSLNSILTHNQLIIVPSFPSCCSLSSVTNRFAVGWISAVAYLSR